MPNLFGLFKASYRREPLYALVFDHSGETKYLLPAEYIRTMAAEHAYTALYLVRAPDRNIIVIVRDEMPTKMYLCYGGTCGTVKVIPAFLVTQHVAHAVELQFGEDVYNAIDALARGVKLDVAQTRVALRKIAEVAGRILSDMTVALAVAMEYKRIARMRLDPRIILFAVVAIAGVVLLTSLFGGGGG